MAIALNTIKDKRSASRAKMRVGRGIGSGKGKTCGRGHKGQKSRSGVSISWFEGGQSPLYRRLPKRGFNNADFKKVYAVVNTGDLERLSSAGKISGKVGYGELRELGEIAPGKDGLKVLARGELKAKLDVSAAVFSKGAKAAIEKVGGTAAVIAPAKSVGKKVKLEKPSRPARLAKKKAARK